jgi:hypothetical protein
MISVRAYGVSQHRARQAAMACVEMLVAESRLDRCSFPERIAPAGTEKLAPVEHQSLITSQLTDKKVVDE